MKIPHPIPYQGSKRNIAKHILPFMPSNINRLVEPFAGSAAISIATAFYGKSQYFLLNDINNPLIALLKKMVYNPEQVIERYAQIWNNQLDNPKEYYIKMRDIFNQTNEPEILLYLLARCVKNAVRYNDKGEFNQSPDNRRKGRSPERMKTEILNFSHLFKNNITFMSKNYEDILDNVNENDWVYMDPPYMGTVGSSRRYIKGLELDYFINNLEKLNNKNIPFLISFDGKTGKKVYGEDLPSNLQLQKVSIYAGKSSQATLQGKSEDTIESLYISKTAFEQLNISNHNLNIIKGHSNSEKIRLELN